MAGRRDSVGVPVTDRQHGRLLRRPGLFWMWLHVPVTLVMYAPAIQIALSSVPGSYPPMMAASYVAQAGFLATLAYLVTLPLSASARVYAIAVPLVAGLGTAAQFVDSQLYQAVGFHVNGLFFHVLRQPGALREVGIPTVDVIVFALAAAAWTLIEVVVGRRFLLRFATERRALTWTGAMLSLVLVERLGSAVLTFNGGLAVDAAEQVLPLQPPIRLNRQVRLLMGRPGRSFFIPGASAQGLAWLANETDAASVRFTRTPDVLFVLIESLRADFLDPDTMPRLWRRAGGGTVFERHYATASSTHYSLFSLFYGMNSHKLEAVVGAGRTPRLFDVLKANAYRSRFIAASSVDWMDLPESVFRHVKDELETHLNGEGDVRDADMLRGPTVSSTPAARSRSSCSCSLSEPISDTRTRRGRRGSLRAGTRRDRTGAGAPPAGVGAGARAELRLRGGLEARRVSRRVRGQARAQAARHHHRRSRGIVR